MGQIPDANLKIREIPIIPGSHNSGTAKAGGFYFGAYQVARQQHLSIAEQLEAGVRLLDIRLRYNEGARRMISCFGGRQGGPTLDVVHTFATCYFLEGILQEVKTFLENHKSEFVVFMIRADWPPNKSFAATDDLKTERVAKLSAVLQNSGIDWAPNVGMHSVVGNVRGKAILVSDWFQEGNDELKVPHLTKWQVYSVCDIWDENPGEQPALKVDRFMQSTDTFNVGMILGSMDRLSDPKKKGPRVCGKLPGSMLLTGVALDRTHGYIVPPGLTSWRWNAWFLKNLETNPNWRPQMESYVPVGVVSMDFADRGKIRRLLEVGFRMLKKKALSPAISVEEAGSE